MLRSILSAVYVQLSASERIDEILSQQSVNAGFRSQMVYKIFCAFFIKPIDIFLISLYIVDTNKKG